jgi:hypothetical protein
MTLPVSESFILGCIGAIGGLITITFSAVRKSRCSDINCLCFRCKREVMTKEELEIDHSAGAEKKERSNSIVV